jgi:CHAT domain-containing protein
MRAGHEEHLHQLFNQAIWNRAADRQTTFTLMQQAQAHLVYFYCHGGVNASNIPFIQIGALTERGITRDNLRLKKIFWKEPRPLIFINGCHTTALEPESAFELVSGFVETAGAAGVIGTEITIFEPLATSFAESFLQAFNQGVEVGEAVRIARLALLKQMNPLGLAYIPYAMANLHLEYQD